MNWFTGTFTSSIGKKLIMSIAGLFLVVFLVVHLGINFLVLLESGDSFNIAAHFMATNIVVKVFEIVLFLTFILHMLYGLILQIQNWMARPVRYKKENLTNQTSFFSKYMIHTAIIVGVFLVLHIGDFYVKSKFLGEVGSTIIHGEDYHDMSAMVIERFQIPGYIIFYLASFLFLAFHLNHAFQSAFQTLGVNHNKYSPIIKACGVIYSILIPLGFAFIALYIYFVR